MKTLIKIFRPFDFILDYLPYMLAGALITWTWPELTVNQILGTCLAFTWAGILTKDIKKEREWLKKLEKGKDNEK